MSIPVARLNHAVLFVRDVARSVAFYQGLFGWEAEQDPRPEAGGYTMFSLNGKHVAAGSAPPIR